MSKDQNDDENFPQRSGASGGTRGRPASGFDAQPAVKVTIDGVTVGEMKNITVSETPVNTTVVELPAAVLRKAPPYGLKEVAKPAPTPLQLLTEEMAKTEKRATIDLDATDPRTRPGREGAKREARELLVTLREKYWQILSKGLCAIFVTGPKAQVAEFVAEAKANGPVDCLAVAADSLYRELAKEVQSSMRTDRLFEPSQFARLISSIMLLCRALGLSEAPGLRYIDGAMLKTDEDVVNHVRKLVRDSCGDQLNVHFLRRLISDVAWEIRYQESVVPVVVTGANAEEAKGLASFFNNRCIQFEVEDKNVTNADVMKAFSTLKNKLRKS